MFSLHDRGPATRFVIVYLVIIALVLYPALHEGFGVRLIAWNFVPPTLGLVLIISALGRSRLRLLASVSFGVVAAAVAIFFFGAWFFTPLDSDPHSATTKLPFVFAPAISIVLASVGSAVAWIVSRAKARNGESLATAAKR